jgi:hypothetical protein
MPLGRPLSKAWIKPAAAEPKNWPFALFFSIPADLLSDRLAKLKKCTGLAER